MPSKNTSHLAGFGLLDTFLTLGIGLGLLVAVMENTSKTGAQLAQVRSKLQSVDLSAQVRTVFAGNNLGEQVLRNFVETPGNPRPEVWGQTFPPVETIRLMRSRVCPLERSLGALGNNVSIESKIPVDVLYLPEAPLVKGLPIKTDPGTRVENLFLVQFGSDGVCPSVASCDQKPCKFMLSIELSGRGSRNINVPLNCSIGAISPSGDDPNSVDGRLKHCSLREVVFPSPTPTASSCPGDLNEDGRVDHFDLRLLSRLWGRVPIPITTGSSVDLISMFNSPDGDMHWVARGSPTLPNPMPNPSFPTIWFNKVVDLYKRADMNPPVSEDDFVGDGYVDGEDLGILLSNFGCELAANIQRPCYSQTPIGVLSLRAAAVAKPFDILDSADRVQYELCIRSSNLSGNPLSRCAAMNLDLKCSKGSGSTAEGNYCRKLTNNTGEPGYRVLSQADLDLLDLLMMMQATRSRFRQQGCTPQSSYPNDWSSAKTPPATVYQLDAGQAMQGFQ